MKKVIALFGGILLSLLAVLNVHAMTDTTIIESPSFEVMSVSVETDIDDAQLQPETVLSELELENSKENSRIWQQVVELHEEASADSHTTYVNEQLQLREAAIAAIEERENELNNTYTENNQSSEVTQVETAQVEYQEPKQEAQYQAPKQEVQQVQQQQQVEQPKQQQAQQPQQQQQSQQQQSQQQQQSGLNWSALAQCESGGNASIVSANGLYHGLYQFNVETWQSVGGSGLPSQASVSEQTMRAQMLFDMRGSQPWPQCGGLLFS